jgi:hypothetical protein
MSPAFVFILMAMPYVLGFIVWLKPRSSTRVSSSEFSAKGGSAYGGKVSS